MAKTTAVHLTGDRIAAIVVDGAQKRWRVVSTEVGEIAPPTENESPVAATSLAASTMLKKMRAPREPVSVAVSSAASVFRNLHLPFTGDDAIEKVLKFECESHLHQFNIDDLIIEHITITADRGSSELIIAAVPKKLLKQQIEAMDRAGFDPYYVDIDALALFNAIIGTGSVGETASSLVMYVGREETIELLIEDRKLRAIRSMRTGMLTLEHAVAQDLGVTEKEAGGKVADLASATAPDLITTFESQTPRGELEKNPAELERDLMTARRDELVRRLQREAIRTAAAEAHRGPDEVLICGEGAGIPGLIEALGEALQIPARELDLFANVEGAPADADVRRRSGVALGAALKGIGIDSLKTNFRQEDLRFAKKLETLKLPLTAICVMLAITLLLQNIYKFREIDSRKQEIANFASVAKSTIIGRAPKKKDEIERKFDGDAPVQRIALYSSYLDSELRNLKNLYGAGGASFTKPQSALEATQRVFNLMKTYQDDLGLFVIDGYAATTDKNNPSKQGVDIRMTVTFLGDSQSCTERCTEFRRRLKSNKWCVDSAEGTSSPTEMGNGVTYEGLTIRVDLTREEVKQ